MSNKFDSLKLNDELIKNLAELEYVEMTPIQKKSLPITLKGNDIIAQAKTGSGKTAAFGLSILNDLDVKNTRIQSLVLCPTRELAEQVAKELRRLARMMKNVKILRNLAVHYVTLNSLRQCNTSERNLLDNLT